jgi:hypothetical protein
MWDHLTALQPATVKEVQTVLILRKLPHQKPDQTAAFKEPEELIQRCNEIWEDQTLEEAATTRTHSPFRDVHHSSSPFREKGSASDRSSRCRSPTLGPSRGGGSDRLCFYHSCFGSKGCYYQEN